MKRLKSSLLWAFTIFIILLIFLQSAVILVPRLLSYDCFAVTSGSMEPTIKTGSLIVTEKVDFNNIKENDIITFNDRVQDTNFTHRVVYIDKEKNWIYTKGDANSANDPTPTSAEYIRGKVVKTIPFIGYIHMFLTSIYGVITISFTVIVWLIIELIVLRKKIKDEKA